MEVNGCTASEADIEYAYHRHSEKYFDSDWIWLSPVTAMSVDQAARAAARWMREHGWKETNV
jgi:hypothetical protein